MLIASGKNLYDAANAFTALAAKSDGYLAQAEQEFLASRVVHFSPFTGRQGVSNIDLRTLRGGTSLRAMASASAASPNAYAAHCGSCANVTVADTNEALAFCTSCGAENIIDDSATATVAVAEGVNMDDYGIELADDDLESLADMSDLMRDTDEDKFAAFDRMVRTNSGRASMVDLDELSLAGGCSYEDDELAMASDVDSLSFAEDDCGEDGTDCEDYEEAYAGYKPHRSVASSFKTMDELFAGASDIGDDDDDYDDEDYMTFSVAGDEYCDPMSEDCDDDAEFGEDYDGDEDDFDSLNDASVDAASDFDIPAVDSGFSDVSDGLAALDGGDSVVVDSLDSYPALAADSISFRYSPSADPSHNSWIAFDKDNRPFAMASAGIVPEKLRAIFATEQYRNSCYAAVAAAGVTGLRNMGFYGFKQEFNVGNSLRETANKARATAAAEYRAELKKRDEEMLSCIAAQAVAMDKCFSGARNPLKDSIIQTATASGLDASVISRIVNQAFQSHGSEYAEQLLRHAENFRQKPMVVREELMNAIASAPYADAYAPPARQGLASAVASVASVPVIPAKAAPVQQATASVKDTGLGTRIIGGLVTINV